MTTLTDNLSLLIEQDLTIDAPLETAFASLLDQLGPRNETPDGRSMAMVLEPRPGGRWFRDLGDDRGHLWGHVQVIKPPTLLEITGPLFMSYAAISHVQFRLTRVDNQTLLALRHQALGLIEEEHRQGLSVGWAHYLEEVRRHAEPR